VLFYTFKIDESTEVLDKGGHFPCLWQNLAKKGNK
jgi:hypothetical protein